MIRIGIVGYGNLGRGVERALALCDDMTLECVVSRRDITVESGVPVISVESALARDDIDVMVLCGGSAADLMVQGPQFAAKFNTVDSYDNHGRIPEYFAMMNAAAKNTVSFISSGWDPGVFSVMKLLSQSILPIGETASFWGEGVSQGHGNAIRSLEGVADAVQYSLPQAAAINAARQGKAGSLTTRDKHKRDCYVVLQDGADAAAIKQQIITMPNYYADYDTTVTFISQTELDANHKAMPHGGLVIHEQRGQTMEFSLKLASNPDYTASVLVACARATARLHAEGNRGAVTILEVAPHYYSPKNITDLRKELL